MMLTADILTEIGTFHRPHGIKGELSATLDYDINIDTLKCLVVNIDGIFVPFFIASHRDRGVGRVLIRLDGVNNEAEAAMFANKHIFALTESLPEDVLDEGDGMYLYDMIGFEIIDSQEIIGTISDVDDSTENILFYVTSISGSTILIPFAEDWIESIDTEKKQIIMDIPDGVLNLNC